MEYYLTCPTCGFKADPCGFPDLYWEVDEDDYPEQYEYQRAIQKLGFNIVRCGECGEVFIHKIS